MPTGWAGSTVLRSKLDIRDEPPLNEAEQQLSAIAADNVEFSSPPYSLAYLQNIHRTLFSDLFEWVEELRTVGMSRQATRFCSDSTLTTCPTLTVLRFI